jgi:pSer/pThr/pTyr-binding forkhead associated (FHA) protein
MPDNPHLMTRDGGRIPLEAEPIGIGRDDTCGISLISDRLVSRAHAEISEVEGQWVLSDLNSRNGTLVNGRKIRQHPLRGGDVIVIGTQEFTFVTDEDPHATEAADIQPDKSLIDLTKREREVLVLVSQGLTDLQIGTSLFISANTVRSHLERIGEKTGLRRRSELTRLAIELGLEN